MQKKKSKVEPDVDPLKSRKTINATTNWKIHSKEPCCGYTYVNGYNWIKTTGQLNSSMHNQRAKIWH